MMMSWSDRFALIEALKPNDAQVCASFGLTQDELTTARSLRDAGTFKPTPNFDVTKYANVFTTDGAASVATSTPSVGARASKAGSATTFVKPESASKAAKVPQKRGRKGDKIASALAAVPTAQVSINTFMQQHGVSLAVLRQSKRFLAKLDPAVATKIGTIKVRQDKATKELMIWREAN
jgi:uncharacterized metal-binding protein